MATHVSFQTGTGWAWAERLDYMVAVFFALSAFVLWRRYALGNVQAVAGRKRYGFSRVARLGPAYLVCVAVVLAALPGARFSVQQVAANLTATQIFWPSGLAEGLTHLWSLCVEFSFYLVLPLLWRWRDRAATPRSALTVLGVAVAASLGWDFLVDGILGIEAVNAQIWPPAYTLWFAVGIAAAEAEPYVRWPSGRRGTWATVGAWALAAGCVWLGSRAWFGPQGLVHPTPGEFARRIVVGGVLAAAVVLPYAWGRRPRLLESPALQLLGQWSYGIFLWHVAALWVAFPLTGIPLFSGQPAHVAVIFALTFAITMPLAAASYYWVEQPAQAAVRRWTHAWSAPAAATAPSAAAANTIVSQESPA